MAAFYLAFAHMRFHATRSVLLIFVLTLLAATPLMTARLSALAEDQLLSRAAATALVYGPPGSPLDQALGALFFEGDARPELTMADYEKLLAMHLGMPIPVLRTHSARGFPVVGTDIEYFDYRNLAITDGRRFVHLGEAVIGSDVARELAIRPGEAIQSDTEQIFELAGAYPVRMTVAGVLAPTGGPDDRVVFCDLRTAWVVAGHGHGHMDLAKNRQADVILDRKDDRIIANAKLRHYVEVTDDNRDDFHFHGSPTQFPLTAILVDPGNDRNAALMRGRVEDAGSDRQVFRPLPVIRGLLNDVFRIKDMLGILVGAVSLAAGLALAMVIGLSLKLRRREFEIARRIGADILAMPRLVAAELVLLAMASGLLCAALLIMVDIHGVDILRRLLFGA